MGHQARSARVIVDAAKQDNERAKKLLEQIGQDFADMHAAELAEEME
jgi:hypothetical protein